MRRLLHQMRPYPFIWTGTRMTARPIGRLGDMLAATTP
jgi:hypothetical protein